MSEIKCSDYYLDKAPTECFPIRILRSKKIYPIVWIGEKTDPTIIGWGKLVKLIFNDNSIAYFIQRYAVIKDDPIISIPKYREIIVTGGIKPTIIKYVATLWAITNYIDDLLNSIRIIHDIDMDILIPSGIGYKTYAILGKEVKVEWDEIEDDYIEIYRPSEVNWIRVNNGYVVDIKRLHPK